jgi:hypothetical protein
MNRGVWGVVLAAGLATGGLAGSGAGTSGAAFLKIGAGARPAGMGEAYTAVADDVNALAWNPAGLGRVTSPQMTATRTQWVQDTEHNYLAAAIPSPAGVWALGMTSLSVEDIPARSGDTDAPDGVFASRDAAYTVGWGKTLGKDWAAGSSLSYIRQSLAGRSATAMSLSGGALWRTPHRPLILGLALRHVGTEVKFDEEGDPLPMTVAVGGAYRMKKGRYKVASDLLFPRDNGVRYAVGVELMSPPVGTMTGALRAGYNSGAADVADGSGVSLGAGLQFTRWSVDVAWAPYGNLGQTLRYAFLVKF